MRALWALLLVGCVTPAPKPPVRTAPSAAHASSEEHLARRVLQRFIEAVDRRDFAAALSSLGPPWAERYTPERLERDFNLESLALERIERLRRGLSLPIEVAAETASLKMTNDKIARLIKINGQWKLVALE